MKVHKQVLIAGLLLAIGGLGSTAQAGIISVFDGGGVGSLRFDWEAAVGAYMEEDFAGGDSDDFSVAIAGGGHNRFSINGTLKDRLSPGSGSVTTIAFDFEIFAFGANWDLSPREAGRGIRLYAGGLLVPIEVPTTHTGEFFGFISDVGFTQLVLDAGTQGGAPDRYTADDFVYSAFSSPIAEPVAVPVPGTLALLVLGALLGIGLGRRRPQQA
ncbi:PEP-CTERM sorting domain-containing protein [Marinobacterium aestuariivivens]|uniref:PEP-CTERM sorting domain-containing protein n=1 Tax=Marinobacterium aestuariivivens TaxID=1698799 RepID=A0ABW1ZW63_9GAMM